MLKIIKNTFINFFDNQIEEDNLEKFKNFLVEKKIEFENKKSNDIENPSLLSWKIELEKFLEDAIQYNAQKITRYLIEEGAPISQILFIEATKRFSYSNLTPFFNKFRHNQNYICETFKISSDYIKLKMIEDHIILIKTDEKIKDLKPYFPFKIDNKLEIKNSLSNIIFKEEEDNVALVKFIAEEYQYDIVSFLKQENKLAKIIKEKKYKILNYFLEKIDTQSLNELHKIGIYPLHDACRFNDIIAVILLLDKEIEINILDKNGLNAKASANNKFIKSFLDDYQNLRKNIGQEEAIKIVRGELPFREKELLKKILLQKNCELQTR